jgi:hypothetical protein
MASRVDLVRMRTAFRGRPPLPKLAADLRPRSPAGIIPAPAWGPSSPALEACPPPHACLHSQATIWSVARRPAQHRRGVGASIGGAPGRATMDGDYGTLSAQGRYRRGRDSHGHVGRQRRHQQALNWFLAGLRLCPWRHGAPPGAHPGRSCSPVRPGGRLGRRVWATSTRRRLTSLCTYADPLKNVLAAAV